MFLPIGDDNRGRARFPFIVYILIAANAYVWWLQLSSTPAFAFGYSFVPYEVARGVDLASAVRVRGPHGEPILIPQAPGPNPIWLTVLSAMFMHGGWMHILGNLLYLVVFGDQIEDRLGHLRFLIFYLGAGIGAAAAQIFFDPASKIPCLGASGAIAGVLGAYFVLHPRNAVKVLIWHRVTLLPASFVLGMWFVLQLFGQFGTVGGAGGVAYMAHIGGFISGVALLAVLKPTGNHRG